MISGGFMRGNPPAHWHSIDTYSSSIFPANENAQTGDSWPSVNMAIYVPYLVQARGTVRKLWYYSTSTGGGNIDIGLYDATGTRLASSGSTAKSLTSAPVVLDVTDVVIGPGIYYVALVASSATSNNFWAWLPSAPMAAAIGVYTEASALPLPATATFALTQTLAYVPVMGMFLNTAVS
jgi:hypothetical protein